ncbi:hypothetical protein AYO41_05370 [Verrucomicrobia bacterium SCGC AG-212-E04]|nr:hypothetical protein AYO41_05370 [Verrucomicrobia bacterium SCGC AG-212-E04]
MSLATEAELVQNSGVGAALVWAFTLKFYDQTDQARGPLLPLILPVLPMTFHQETVDALYRRNFDGGLDLGLAENRTLTIDLQERTQAMLPQTMQALNIAFATGLLTYLRPEGELRPVRRTAPFRSDSEELRRMLSTATRLGYWFATINSERLGSLLRIRL